MNKNESGLWFGKYDKKTVIRQAIRFGVLLAFLGCIAIILIESLMPAKQSSDHSNAVGDLVDVTVDRTVKPESLEMFSYVYGSLEEMPSTVHIGDKITLAIKFKPDNTTDQSVLCEISDPSIAVYSENTGRITFLAVGEVTVTVKSRFNESISDTATLTVASIGVASVTANADCDVSALEVGDSFKITAGVLPSNATNQQLVYTSDNPSVVTVTQNGAAQAVGVGTALITVASAENADAFATVSVCVVPTATESVTLLNALGEPYGDALELVMTSKVTLTVLSEVLPENATDRAVSWTVTGDGAVTCEDKGSYVLLHFESYGTYTVTACCGEFTDTLTVTVRSVFVQTLTLYSGTQAVEGLEMTEKEKLTLSCEIYPAEAVDASLVWKSSDQSVVAVKNGKLTAKSEGVAVITVYWAEDESVCDSVTVRVTKVEKTIVDVTELNVTLADEVYYVGESEALSVTYAPSDATYKSFAFESDNPSVATVSSRGVVSFIAPGTATITVSTVNQDKNGSLKTDQIVKSVEVTVKAVNLVSIGAEDVSLFTGESKTLEYQLITDVEGRAPTCADVTFASDNESVVAVDSQGTVCALRAGVAHITVTGVGNPQAVAVVTITVADIVATDLNVYITSEGDTEEVPCLKIGMLVSLTVEITPVNVTDGSLRFASSDTDVLTVDALGNISAVGAGTATVTVTAAGGYSTAYTVRVANVLSLAGINTSGFTVDENGEAVITHNESGKIYVIFGEDATYTGVTFASDNEDVATVSLDGTITAVGKGVAIITVTYDDGDEMTDGFTYRIRLTVEKQTMSDYFSNWAYLVRKGLGHFSAFFITGIFGTLTYLLFFMGKNKWFAPLASLVSGYAVAALSEHCQFYTEGRGPSFSDVKLDFEGYSIATLTVLIVFGVVALVRYLVQKKKNGAK